MNSNCVGKGGSEVSRGFEFELSRLKMAAHLLVEEGVEGLAVHLRLELLLPLRVRHQEHLKEEEN